MRIALTLSALLLIATRLSAGDAAAPARQLPTDDTIIKLSGDSMANMFAKCGVPDDIFVNGDKDAILDYGTFGFAVKKKIVTCSYFFDGWKGTFKGVKFGDTKEQAVKVIGTGYREVTGKDFDAYGWELKDQKATFWLYFTDNKVDRVQITPDN